MTNASTRKPTSPKPPLTRVLVVEDDLTIARTMQLGLSRSMIEATIIISGEEALTRLATDTYDLILLDIALPGLDGLEVCRRLKTSPRLQDIPVIFVSGQTSRAYKDEAKRLGAVDFIEKPFDLLPFLSCIMGHLKLRASGQRGMQRTWPLAVP